MDPTDVVRYAVHVVLVEDCEQAYEDTLNVADSWVTLGDGLTYEQAIALLLKTEELRDAQR